MPQRVPSLVAELGADASVHLHLYAALTEKERAIISARTKAPLAAAKERGTHIDNPQIATAQAKGTKQPSRRRAICAQHPAAYRAAEGASLREIAEVLNAPGIATARGKGRNASC